jgi:single-strand selective monofunctional uracil DNA glycosylase
LWGWARQRFKTPRVFFKRFGVVNYCPLAFMEAGGRNRTPDKLPRQEIEPVLKACDQALLQTAELLKPRIVVGVGKFAAQQACRALADTSIQIGQITHPSPANPKANAGWSELIELELRAMGVRIEGG